MKPLRSSGSTGPLRAPGPRAIFFRGAERRAHSPLGKTQVGSHNRAWRRRAGADGAALRNIFYFHMFFDGIVLID